MYFMNIPSQPVMSKVHYMVLNSIISKNLGTVNRPRLFITKNKYTFLPLLSSESIPCPNAWKDRTTCRRSRLPVMIDRSGETNREVSYNTNRSIKNIAVSGILFGERQSHFRWKKINNKKAFNIQQCYKYYSHIVCIIQILSAAGELMHLYMKILKYYEV